MEALWEWSYVRLEKDKIIFMKILLLFLNQVSNISPEIESSALVCRFLHVILGRTWIETFPFMCKLHDHGPYKIM